MDFLGNPMALFHTFKCLFFLRRALEVLSDCQMGPWHLKKWTKSLESGVTHQLGGCYFTFPKSSFVYRQAPHAFSPLSQRIFINTNHSTPCRWPPTPGLRAVFCSWAGPRRPKLELKKAKLAFVVPQEVVTDSSAMVVWPHGWSHFSLYFCFKPVACHPIPLSLPLDLFFTLPLKAFLTLRALGGSQAGDCPGCLWAGAPVTSTLRESFINAQVWLWATRTLVPGGGF